MSDNKYSAPATLHYSTTPVLQYRVHSLNLRFSQAYLIETDSGLFLVDTGPPRSEGKILKALDILKRGNLKLIFITHAHLDHYGSAAALRRVTGAPIAVHRADGEAMARGETRMGTARGAGRLLKTLLSLLGPFLRPEATPPDILLNDGDDLRSYGLAARVVHAPGHTRGSSCLLVDDRLAFVGDLLTTTLRPRLQRFFAEDWSLIPGSLERLMGRQPQWIYSGHGRAPVSGDCLFRLR